MNGLGHGRSRLGNNLVLCHLWDIYSLFLPFQKSDLSLGWSDLWIELSVVKEIGALGFVTLARQAVVSVTVLLVNNILFALEGESLVAVYAIISRMLMFALFPILGITQGFVPIAGLTIKETQRTCGRGHSQSHHLRFCTGHIGLCFDCAFCRKYSGCLYQ